MGETKFLHVTSAFDFDQYELLKASAKKQRRVVGLALNDAIAMYLQAFPIPESIAVPQRKHRPKVYLNSELVWSYMRRNNLKDGDMADRLGIARENLNRVLHHRMPTSADLGQRLVNETGLSYDQLFSTMS